MSIEARNERISFSQPQDQEVHPDMNLVSQSRASDQYVANLPTRELLALSANASMAACDVLYESQPQLHKINKLLSGGAGPGDRGVGNLVSEVMQRGMGTMQMRVDRLNDYLNGGIGPRTGFQASWDETTGRITLTQVKTGTSASYAVRQVEDRTIVNPVPVAQTYYRPRR